jgi:hypothetical protein
MPAPTAPDETKIIWRPTRRSAAICAAKLLMYTRSGPRPTTPPPVSVEVPTLTTDALHVVSAVASRASRCRAMSQ